MSIISLITDFGLEDAYVGIVKGAILSVNPSANVIDVCHGIAPQDVIRTAYLLEAAYEYFPPGTIHVVVVDPGVGSDRAVVAVEMSGYRFLAPDNGVLTEVLSHGTVERSVFVENSRYFLTPVSQTFHGRDIFAPVAAHLSKGLDMAVLGPPDALVRLPLPKPVITDASEIVGCVITSDRFGNLITNIRDRDLAEFCESSDSLELTIRIGGRTLAGLSDSYASMASGEPMAIMGSARRLEISIDGGSAEKYFNAGPGEEVRVTKTCL